MQLEATFCGGYGRLTFGNQQAESVKEPPALQQHQYHTQLCPASPQLHCPLEISFRNSPLQAASCVVVVCEISPGIVNCHDSS